MAQRSGPTTPIKANAAIVAASTWYAMTTFQMGKNSNCIKLYFTLTTGGCGTISFKADVSPDKEVAYYPVTHEAESPTVWGPFTAASAGNYAVNLTGIDAPPGEFVKVYYQVSDVAAAPELAVTSLAYESAQDGNLSAGDIEVAIDSIEVDVGTLEETIYVDDAAFTPGTSKLSATGAMFDDVTPDSVDEGDIGIPRMSANRNQYATIRDAAGNERGANVDASNQLGVVEASGAAILSDTTAILADTTIVASAIQTDDAAYSGGEKGVMLLTVRQDDANALSDTDNDFTPLTTSDHGCLNIDAQHYFTVDECEATTGWTVLGNDTINLATTTEHVRGTLALTFDKTDGAANTVFGGIQKTITSLSANKHIEEGGGFWLYSYYLSDLSEVSYLFFRAGTDSTNYNEWRVPDTALIVGWNNVRIPMTRPADSVGNGWDSSAVTYISLGAAFDAQNDALADMRIDTVMCISGLQVSADLTAQVSSDVSSPNVNVRKWGANNVSTNTGVVGDGTLRATLATDVLVPAGGNVAHDAVDSGAPLKIGGKARTANPAAVAGNDRVDAMFDDVGRQVVIAGGVRDLIVQQHTELTDANETTVLTAGAAGVYHDITQLIVSNFDIIPHLMEIRDDTGQTVMMKLALAANGGGAVMRFNPPFKQTAVADNWTAKLNEGIDTTNVYVTIQAVANI